MLGSTAVIVKLEHGTSLAEAIVKIVSTAADAMPELRFYTLNRFVLHGLSAAPAGCQSWDDAWDKAAWSKYVETAQDCRAPPTWGAKLIVMNAKNSPFGQGVSVDRRVGGKKK